MVVGSNAHIYSFPMNYVFLNFKNTKFPNLEREYPGFKEFQGFAKCSIFGNLANVYMYKME
jgi:hypothetical protein